MTREAIASFFKKHIEAMRQRDAEALAANYAADAVVETPAAGTVRGRTEIQDIFETWFAAFPDSDFQVEELLIDGDRVAQFFKTVGTHEGTFFGASPTGKRFEARGVFLYRLKENLIVHERRVYDFTSVLLQIGVLRAKPR
jgi:steroid delta-isomerase-like uncharacterized protein